MIKIIQISDFHNVETTANKMMRQKVCESIRNINPDILLFTGDLHNYGENFEPFKNYINDLMSEGELTSKDVFIVPGNHDIDRELSKNEEKNRKAYIGCILGEVEKDTDCYKIYREELAACFKGFNNTMNEVLGEAYKTDTVYHYIWNKRINIITLNTALISDGRDHQQIIDTNKLADLNPCNGLPTIIIGHHDISCLFDSHQSILKSLMASWKVSFYLCGDRHKNKQGLLDDVMCNNVKIPVIVAGKGSVENHDNYSDVSFLVYEIDEESNNVNLSLCNWDNEKKTFVSGIFENNELKPSFELRYSPKRKKSSKSKLPQLYENDELEAISDKWQPPSVQGYVLIGTQGKDGIKYIWKSGEAVFESLAFNQKQCGDLRGNQDHTISTYAASVSSGCILQAMKQQCSFCDSGKITFNSLLSYREIALQNIFMSIYDDDCECHSFLKDNKREFSYTAQGEPGYSYFQVRKAIILTERVLLENKPENFIMRHVIYTCGFPEFLDSLADDINNHVFRRPVALHFSLNAVGKIRKMIMPVDKQYSYKQMLNSCKAFYQKTNGCTGKIAINLIAFNKYEYQGFKYTIDESNIKEILDEIGDAEIFRINLYDYYSEQTVNDNRGNMQIERLYSEIKKYGYEVKICHCWGDRVKSAFGMLDASTEGLSDLGEGGQRNYQKSVELIEKYLDI